MRISDWSSDVCSSDLGMLVGLAADVVTLGRDETIQRGVDGWALRFHHGPVERTDIVQVDIDRQAVETEVEHIERRPALEDEALRQDRIAGDLLQQVQKPPPLFEARKSDVEGKSVSDR